MKLRFALSCLFALVLTGCAGLEIKQAAEAVKGMTPEQIASVKDLMQATKDIGADVYVCFTIAGPPPAGNAVFVVTPKNQTPTAFGDNCHILPR